MTRSVARTAIFNIIATGTAAGAGVIIARSLGPTIRGEYAAILAWYGVMLIVGELGQTAATTFFVAQNPGRAPDYLATSRNMMTISGVVTLVAGILVAPVLARGDGETLWGYRVMFMTCLAGFVGASYTFSLQSSNLTRWNLLRISQPVLFATAVAILHLVGHLGLMTVLVTLSITTVMQTVLGYWFCVNERLTGGKAVPALARPMARYGLGQLAASMPAAVTARLDQLVLSLSVAPAALGHYAVAASMTTIAVPVVSAVGYVAFPRLASQTLSPTVIARLQRKAVLASIGAGLALMLPLACLTPWLVPTVFGPQYRDAIPLTWFLVPSGIFLGCGQVCGDLLRGRGRPMTVARVQTAAALTNIFLLTTLLPAFGVAGAAIAASTAAGVAFLLMEAVLRRLSAQTPTTASTTAPFEAQSATDERSPSG
jgi:O-antigen/teichoic acid export membrane protein